ncbi:hypothetical protein GCM10010313_37340 [Streptomyces violarus]|uniref:Uncharacterized protein n=1 Tax=Streptomyces violarus TaxID=67380 RepID=A0A7W5F5U8_9ACTN|nr:MULTISPECIES: hypothetical protein [Streptomyces]MBB3081210.1 hypothetical protein [Streptomyces violarus]WRU00317.1 hypothetical protein VJ737_22700 [Streptomyces sp. CGMCC 4.1772]GHD13007.1 hypothetical protein GCM10010313_37340 [Streptomyces violarus]
MTTSQQFLVRAAARNNAEWCAAMCRAHGVAGEFGAEAWAASVRTPPYYPDAVTLEPDADRDALVARIDTASPGASVKDSFADLELAEAGFQVLFEARWIHRPAGAGAPVIEPDAPDLLWDVAGDPDTLRAWALAWDDGAGHADLFRTGLLTDPETFVILGRSAADPDPDTDPDTDADADADGRVVAGAVASRSEHVVGVSNVFARDGGPDAAWPVVLHALARLFPTLPVVGYEQGDDLAVALRYGFEPLGPLRVWTHHG